MSLSSEAYRGEKYCLNISAIPTFVVVVQIRGSNIRRLTQVQTFLSKRSTQHKLYYLLVTHLVLPQVPNICQVHSQQEAHETAGFLLFILLHI